MFQIIAYFLPEELRSRASSDELQRAQMVVVSVLVTVAITFGSCAVYYSLGSDILAHFSVLQCVCCLMSLVILKVFKSLTWSMLWLLFVLSSMFMVSTVITGGVFSILAYTLYIPPILALMFFSRKIMLIVFGSEIVFILGLMVIAMYNIPLPKLFELEGKPMWYAWIAIALLTGVVFSFYLADSIRNSAMRLAEEERDSVKEKVRQATQTLAEQNVQLQEAMQATQQAQQFQSDFLRNVSHEVRTPLASIMGFSEILRNRADPPSEEIRLEFAKQIGYAGEQLHEIFNNLMMLSQLESSGIEVCLEPVHVPSILRDIGHQYSLQAAQKGLRYSMHFENESSELMVTTDARHLGVIIRQLLSNAIKFTEKGEVVLEISLREMPLEERINTDATSYIRIGVRDTGIGIAKEHVERLFKPFQQQDASKNRQFGGLGLGLAITLRLVTVLKGQISCTSEVSKGSSFTVEIPVKVIHA